MRRWSPLLVDWHRLSASVTVRIPRLAGVRLKGVWREWGDVEPHVSLELDLWRLHAWLRIGGFWRDDEGDRSSLFNIGADFSTFDIPNLICRFRGHVPRDMYEEPGRYVYCDRCHETLSEAGRPVPPPDGGRELDDDHEIARAA